MSWPIAPCGHVVMIIDGKEYHFKPGGGVAVPCS